MLVVVSSRRLGIYNKLGNIPPSKGQGQKWLSIDMGGAGNGNGGRDCWLNELEEDFDRLIQFSTPIQAFCKGALGEGTYCGISCHGRSIPAINRWCKNGWHLVGIITTRIIGYTK